MVSLFLWLQKTLMGSGFFMRENATGKIWAYFAGNTPGFLQIKIANIWAF